MKSRLQSRSLLHAGILRLTIQQQKRQEYALPILMLKTKVSQYVITLCDITTVGSTRAIGAWMNCHHSDGVTWKHFETDISLQPWPSLLLGQNFNLFVHAKLTLPQSRKPISLISHSDVRYRGILAGIDPAASTIQLSNGISISCLSQAPSVTYCFKCILWGRRPEGLACLFFAVNFKLDFTF